MSNMSIRSRVWTRLVYPGSLAKSTRENLAAAYPDGTIHAVATPGGYQVGLLLGLGSATAAVSRASATDPLHLLYFYGNGMSLQSASYEFSRFRQLGFNILIPEYLGFGMSSGLACENGCYETADVAYTYLRTRLHVGPERIVVAGWSLGAAIAIDLAARESVAGLIALSPFTGLREEVRAVFPWMPKPVVRLLVDENFDNLSKIGSVSCPTFIAHGVQDELVPFAMAERLAQAIPHRDQVTFVPLPGCGHNDIFDVPSLWRGIENFTRRRILNDDLGGQSHD